METELGIVQLAIQGGLAGVAGLALWILFKVVTNHQSHTDTIIERNTEASAKASVTHEVLAKSIERMSEIIEKKL